MVTYRMAKPGGEYNRLYALMRKENGKQEPLGWPVVVAEEDGKVVGFLATWPDEELLMAGPLVIEGSKRMWMFIRLVEAYENVLRATGVKQYLFTVEKSNEKQLARIRKVADGFHLTQVRETDTHVSFLREL